MVRERGAVAPRQAFSLIEVMVASSIAMVIIAVLLSVVSRVADGTRAAATQADHFQQAQRAFETLGRRIEQATLSSYWDSYSVNATVRRYQRMSELRFVCGPMQCGANPLDSAKPSVRPGHGVFFQTTSGRMVNDSDPALLGLGGLINSWGYFVEVGTDSASLPSFLAGKADLDAVAPRLVEICEPPKRLSIYGYTSGAPDYSGFEWFRVPLADATLRHIAAENIAVLLVQPKLTGQEAARLLPGASAEERDALLAPQLFYHSGAPVPPGTPVDRNMRHRLPAMVELTMVALGSATVSRIYSATSLDPLKVSDAFRNATSLRAELQGTSSAKQADSLEGRLVGLHANYRIFSATIPIRSAQ
jgi:uncharacterized protein (TIGR02599 family)